MGFCSVPASKYQGTSLNENLLPGPDLFQKFVGILFNFWGGAVALIANIQHVFFQFEVKEDDTHSLRFLYSDSENENERIVIYKYNRHIFGARNSPKCAHYALTRTLEVDNLHHLSNILYMDDFIFPSSETENFKKQVVENLSRGVSKRRKSKAPLKTCLKMPMKSKHRFWDSTGGPTQTL